MLRNSILKWPQSLHLRTAVTKEEIGKAKKVKKQQMNNKIEDKITGKDKSSRD